MSIRVRLLAACLGCLLPALSICGCQLRNGETPGGNSRGWGSLPFASVPSQTEPVVDSDFDDSDGP